MGDSVDRVSFAECSDDVGGSHWGNSPGQLALRGRLSCPEAVWGPGQEPVRVCGTSLSHRRMFDMLLEITKELVRRWWAKETTRATMSS